MNPQFTHRMTLHGLGHGLGHPGHKIGHGGLNLHIALLQKARDAPRQVIHFSIGNHQAFCTIYV